MRNRPNRYSNADGRAGAVSGPSLPGRSTAANAKKRGGSMLYNLMGWILLVSMTVPWTVFTPLAEQEAGGVAYSANTWARIIKLSLLAISAVILASNWAATMRLIKQLNRFFVVFLLLVPVSIIWSISRPDTLARFITIMSVVLVWSAICVADWEPQRFQKLLRPVFTFLILGSILFALTSPELAIETGEGTLKDAWKGLTSQKNPFGQLSSFTYVFWLHAWLSRQASTWKAVVFGACGGACVLLSRSSTSLLASVFVTGFLLLLLRAPSGWRRVMPYLVGGFATLVCTYALAILNLVPGLGVLLRPITAFTGKDMTFSNRSVIWDIIKEHIDFAPWLGSGYGAFWIGPVTTSPSYAFIIRMYFYPNESHNGYLEMVNDLGFVGLLVLLGFLIWYLRQALSLLRFDRNQGALYLAVFFLQAIVNLSESTWLVVNAGVSFTVMTFATIALGRSLVEQRSAAVAVPQNLPPRRGVGRLMRRLG